MSFGSRADDGDGDGIGLSRPASPQPLLGPAVLGTAGAATTAVSMATMVNYPAAAQSSEARAAREAATWVPDAEKSHCMIEGCSLEFWTWCLNDAYRRHHCRSCGWVVCKACLAPEPLALDRWVSSQADHAIRFGTPTKAKTVCRACAEAAPAEVAKRLGNLKYAAAAGELAQDVIGGGKVVKRAVTAAGRASREAVKTKAGKAKARVARTPAGHAFEQGKAHSKQKQRVAEAARCGGGGGSLAVVGRVGRVLEDVGNTGGQMIQSAVDGA
jgi:hypothetical protein